MDDASLVMVDPGFVANRDRVSKQAVTKLVRQMAERNGLPIERDSRGRIARFSLAHYDHNRGQFASSARVQAARQDEGEPPTPLDKATKDSRDEALRRQAWVDLGRKQIERQETLKQLVRADRLRDGLATSGREIQSLVARLPNKADDLAMAVSREGVHGLRTMLRQIAYEMNQKIADRLAEIAEDAPATDPLLEDEDDQAEA
jgi:hypothetical protein